MIKTICDAITQEFYSWELKEDVVVVGQVSYK
jgi:hypothetical protein